MKRSRGVLTELVRDIKEAADVLTSICHASGNPIAVNSSQPLYSPVFQIIDGHNSRLDFGLSDIGATGLRVSFSLGAQSRGKAV